MVDCDGNYTLDRTVSSANFTFGNIFYKLLIKKADFATGLFCWINNKRACRRGGLPSGGGISPFG
jgi:hypothetical protein